jgi:1-acyl-sn-glycerol-3-phosphate acyltransferase
MNKTNSLADPYDWQLKQATSKILNQAVQELIWLSGTAIYSQWFQLECRGLENLPQEGGYIMAANHTSHLDSPAIIAACGQHLNRVYSLAAQDYFFDRPVKSWLCRNWLNMIPFKRRGNFLDCLPTCQEVIARQQSILFFPEGTRSKTGQLQPLKLGLGILVMKLKVPVVPVHVRGTYQALPKGKVFPKKYPIQVCFGSPLDFRHYLSTHDSINHHQIYRELVNHVYIAIQELKMISEMSVLHDEKVKIERNI